MNVIIPCAGLGSRFQKNGFVMPKPLIKCMMKPFLCWIIDSIVSYSIKDAYIYVTVVTNPNYDSYYTDIASMYENVYIIFIPILTKGAADTIAQTITKLPLNRHHLKTVCMDCDNFYNVDILSICAQHSNTIVTFNDKSTLSCFSFVEISDNDVILRIVEKNRISCDAVCGVYAFNDATSLLKYATQATDRVNDSSTEIYMSSVVQGAIDDSVVFHNHSILADNYICVGTPSQLYSFNNSVAVCPMLNSNFTVPKKRICFDLDSTLVYRPTTPGDYNTCRPIQENIDMCNYLKTLNHYIIIHTARRMRTHNGNVGGVIKDIGKLTLDSLHSLNIRYDELIFGKPYADVYIDDKSINANDDLQKMLGVYFDTFETRSFNTIENDIFPIIKKQSVVDLSFEIFWYTHVPSSIKDMFPIFISADPSGYSYVIEKIQGTTVSDMLVDGRLHAHLLDPIMRSLRRIHSSVTCGTQSYSKQFYLSKLKNRRNSSTIYNDYDSNDLYFNEFLQFFSNYSFVPSNIHGDPVFTNIIINRFNKLKFIDMRGDFGDGPSLIGDPLYDLAKINQSVVGYDFILKGIVPNEVIIQELKSHFDDYIHANYGHDTLDVINVLTRYLIYTMLPLHQDRSEYVIMQFIHCMNSNHLAVRSTI